MRISPTICVLYSHNLSTSTKLITGTRGAYLSRHMFMYPTNHHEREDDAHVLKVSHMMYIC